MSANRSADSSQFGAIDPRSVAAAIKERKTLKVLGAADDQAVISPETESNHRKLVLEALEIAGWAPFHYNRGEDGLAEPWRAHVLWHRDCQHLAPKLFEWFPEIGESSKISRMMHACGALVLVTWLPQHYHLESRTAAQIAVDEEHLAAASSLVQNLLVMLTAHGMGTYWSSGGKLRSPEFFERLEIPSKERLLAAVFIEYPETQDQERPRVPGRHRESRSGDWIREVSSRDLSSQES